MSLFTFFQSANQLRRAHQTDGLRVVQDRPHELYVYTTLLIACCLSWVALFGNLNGQCGNELRAIPSPGWGPRGQGPGKNRQGPGKNNSTIHVKKSKKTKWQPCCVFHGVWSRRLSHTHSYPGCHAPDRLLH